MRKYYIEILVIYFTLSLILWGIRLIPSATNPVDCQVRYMDIIFPITRLHCPIGWIK